MTKRTSTTHDIAGRPQKRSKKQSSRGAPEALVDHTIGESLCKGCSKIVVKKLFRPPASGDKSGQWGKSIGHPEKDSPCPGCRFFASLMTPADAPPQDIEELSVLSAEFRKWQEKGGPYTLKYFSANTIFGLPHDKKGGAQKFQALDAKLITLVPEWTRRVYYAEKLFKPWKKAIQTHGFIVPLDESPRPKPFTGRRLSSTQIDFGIILNWLAYCDDHHGNLCRGNSDFNFRLKVIDCECREIMPAIQHRPYIALSYVWGTSSSSSGLTFSGALPETLPPVIEDAITVAKRLSHRYLWIDRYCIDQEDAKDKHIQVANMDSIYAGASITIIAATGDASSHGLPGVGSTPRVPQQSIQLGQDILLSSLPDPAHFIRNSKWMSRGWTYQEGLLSKRRLVFTESQVYFQCSAMHCFESMNLPLDSLHVATASRTSRFREDIRFARLFPLVGIARKPMDIFDRINEYASRSLSYDSDALNAFRGILKVFETPAHPVYHHWGVPIFSRAYPDVQNINWITRFAWGLTWVTQTAGKRRKGLPSWSWIGWKSWENLSFPHSVVLLGRDPEPNFRHANLRIGIHSAQRPHVSRLEWNDLDTLRLDDTSHRLEISAYTTMIQCRRSESTLVWKIEGQELSFPDTAIVNIFKDCQGEFVWKGILIGYKDSILKDTKLGTSQNNVLAVFLLVEQVSSCYERIGFCSFDLKAIFTEYADDNATIGNMILYRESLHLG